MTRLDTLRERYLSAQLAGDRREAMRLVLDEGFARGTPVLDLQTHVIQAAQNEIGKLWQANKVSIAQEHMATAISQLTLSALFERATPKPPLGKKLLLACVEGEQHDLPARLVADLLDLEGFDVRYLGADVPHDDLLKSVEQEMPDVIGLSVTMSFNVSSVRVAVQRIRAVTSTPIFVGGHATQWSKSLVEELGVVGAGDSPDQLIAIARGLAGVAP
jgi:methanogenic corrinoid protein MtbC1